MIDDDEKGSTTKIMLKRQQKKKDITDVTKWKQHKRCEMTKIDVKDALWQK